MLWEAKANKNDSYTAMKTPSSYKIDYEDLDSNSYRSITNGNLIRKRLSSKWFKGSFSFNYLEQDELDSILNMINNDPLYIRIKSPMFGTDGIIELEVYVSKVSVEMMKNNTINNTAQWINLSFNLVQTKVVNGQ